MPVSLSTSHSVSFDLFFSPQSLESFNKLSNLRQHDLEGVCVALDAEDEGVFVGVVLDDVIVHVHQDPAAKNSKSLISCGKGSSSKLVFTSFCLSHSPFLTFLVHLGYPLCGHTIFLWYLPMRKKNRKEAKNKKAAYEQALGLQTNCAFDISSHVQTERHHSQHPSGLWAWETSASERRTPHLSPFWHTAALQTGGRRAGHLLVYTHNNVPMIGAHRGKHLEVLCLRVCHIHKTNQQPFINPFTAFHLMSTVLRGHTNTFCFCDILQTK